MKILLKSHIMIICPNCKKMVIIKREKTDPKKAIYAYIKCDNCVMDNDNTHYYGDNDFISE